MTTIRCAIYTRKSSEEGLEQDFNSLDAQREACSAYIASQAGEGWVELPDRYDDGGFSGGTMERPALQRLLADVEAGAIDVIVTYKIDRLSRSLADFSRMVEIFERKTASFVSVTQAFNTTTSMGRLTLNVLLSFAQFEREVTGERIRDKIAASKKKGLFMGGRLPLGYDAPGANEPLVLKVNADEAPVVRMIFERYLELGSVNGLVADLDARGIRSKRWRSRRGNLVGGAKIGRGALYYLLRNRTYLGMIPHKEASYPGRHPAIVDPDLFERVQARLDEQIARSKAPGRSTAEAALKGKVFDALGNPMVPTHAHGKSGRLYRYYTSAPHVRGESIEALKGVVSRVPAPKLETIVREAVGRLLGADHPDIVRKLTVEAQALVIETTQRQRAVDPERLRDGETVEGRGSDPETAILILPTPFRIDNGRVTITGGAQASNGPDPKITLALRRAHRLLNWDEAGRPSASKAPTDPYERKLVRLALLAPDIQNQLLTEKAPVGLTFAKLLSDDVSL
ncbi:MAG: recombinase family protein, partial [Pseudomonadota bacterium]